MKIVSMDDSVQRLLTRGYYKVPRFQRPYSWDQENIEEFWNDTIVDSENDYFIGSMVVYKTPDGTFGVVDGQQRITTITIMLAAIRDLLAKIDEGSLASGIQTLIERADIENRKRFVLQTETSYPYFQEHIQKFGMPDTGEDVTEEEQNLRVAYEFFRERIDQRAQVTKSAQSDTKEEKVNRLVAIRNKLLELKLIFIELDNEEDAYLAFETLNTRGKELSVADLVRTQLTSALRPANAGVDLVKERWYEIVRALEESDQEIKLEEFLLHSWLSRYDFTTLKLLFKNFKRKFKLEDLRGFFEGLYADSKLYRVIQDTNLRTWRQEELDLKKAFDALVLFRVKMHLPMALAVWRDYENGALKLKHAKSILIAIENFHFQFTAIVSKRSSGGIARMYANHAKALASAVSTEDKVKQLQELRDKLKARLPTSDQFLAGFRRLRTSEKYSRDKKLVQYVLARYDSAKRQGIAANYVEMTIEHIASQSGSGLSDEVVAEIGNLIYVDHKTNAKLDTKPYLEKRAILEGVRYPFDKILQMAIMGWDQGSIRARTDELGKTAHTSLWAI